MALLLSLPTTISNIYLNGNVLGFGDIKKILGMVLIQFLSEQILPRLVHPSTQDSRQLKPAETASVLKLGQGSTLPGEQICLVFWYHLLMTMA